MTNSEAYKKYEDLLYAVRPSEWDSIHSLRNAINQFCGFLNTYTTFVEPYVNGVSVFLIEFNELIDMLRYDKKEKRSEINIVSDVKSKAILVVKRINSELEKETLIRYKSK